MSGLVSRALASFWLTMIFVAFFAELGFAQEGEVIVELSNEKAHTRFERTLYAVQQMPVETQVRFAKSALYELSLAYREEAGVALLEAENEGGDRTLMAWSRAVERYASDIDRLLAALEEGFPVYLRMSIRDAVSVAVADRVIMLNHPRVGEQRRYEQQVLEHFCARASCNALTASGQKAEPIKLSARQIRPLWSFTSDGPVCSYRELSIAFSSDDNLARARELCVEVLTEALLLAEEVAWQIRHGVIIQWDALELHGTSGRTQHRLTLNDAGDTVIALVPMIYRSKALLQRLAPWVREIAESDAAAPLRLDARDFGWLG